MGCYQAGPRDDVQVASQTQPANVLVARGGEERSGSVLSLKKYDDTEEQDDVYINSSGTFPAFKALTILQPYS